MMMAVAAAAAPRQESRTARRLNISIPCGAGQFRGRCQSVFIYHPTLIIDITTFSRGVVSRLANHACVVVVVVGRKRLLFLFGFDFYLNDEDVVCMQK